MFRAQGLSRCLLAGLLSTVFVNMASVNATPVPTPIPTPIPIYTPTPIPTPIARLEEIPDDPWPIDLRTKGAEIPLIQTSEDTQHSLHDDLLHEARVMFTGDPNVKSVNNEYGVIHQRQFIRSKIAQGDGVASTSQTNNDKVALDLRDTMRPEHGEANVQYSGRFGKVSRSARLI